MQNKEFEKLVDSVTDNIKKVLKQKAKEYAHGDRLSNFKAAASIDNSTPLESAKGMWKKHLVSVLDIISGKLANTEEMVNEKFVDSINYHILMMAILQENRSFYGGIKTDWDKKPSVGQIAPGVGGGVNKAGDVKKVPHLSDICKNCGQAYGIHHTGDNANCPVVDKDNRIILHKFSCTKFKR